MPGPAEMLRAMAERIDRNDPDDFAGCILIIPPEGEAGVDPGEPLEILMLDPARSVPAFWAAVKNRCSLAADEWVTAQQNQGAFR